MLLAKIHGWFDDYQESLFFRRSKPQFMMLYPQEIDQGCGIHRPLVKLFYLLQGLR